MGEANNVFKAVFAEMFLQCFPRGKVNLPTQKWFETEKWHLQSQQEWIFSRTEISESIENKC